MIWKLPCWIENVQERKGEKGGGSMLIVVGEWWVSLRVSWNY